MSDRSLTLRRRNFLKAILNAICTLAVSADIESSASCVYDNDTLSCLEGGRLEGKLGQVNDIPPLRLLEGRSRLRSED